MVDIDTSLVASLRPEDFMEGGGLPSDFRGVVKSSRFRKAGPGYDLPYTPGKPTLVLETIIIPADDSEYAGQEIVDYKSAGSLDLFVPSEDGKTETDVGRFAKPVDKDKKKMSRNSNFAHFMTVVRDAGFPDDKLSVDVSCFDGMDAYWTRIPQMQRKDMAQINPKDGGDSGRVKDILMPVEVYSAGGQAAAGGASRKKSAAAKGTGAASAAPAAADDSGLAEKVAGLVLETLSDGETWPRSRVIAQVVKGLDAAEKKGGMTLLQDPAWVGGEDQPWTFDAAGNTLSL